MKKSIDAEVAFTSIKLGQMGGDFKVINGKTCYVKFNISGIEIAYVYNINKHGKYFLERVFPYPIAIREFNEEDAVIDLIKIDLEQFRNAAKSHNINEFIEINSRLNQTIKKFEDLFLYYNVPKNEVDTILSWVCDIDNEIEKIKSSAERVYNKKEPEFLK